MRRAASAASPVKIEFGMDQRGEVPQGIEIGLQITPAAERIHHAFQLFAVNVHQYSGQGWQTPRPRSWLAIPGLRF